MSQDGATRPWGLSGLAIVAITFASVALNVVLFWSSLRTDDPLDAASGLAAAKAAPLAEPPASPAPGTPFRAGGNGERPRAAGGSSRPDKEIRPTQHRDDGAPTVAAGPQADVGRDRPGARSSLGDAPAASRSTNAPLATSRGALAAAAHTPDSQRGVSAVVPSVPEGSRAEPSGDDPPQDPKPPADDGKGDSDHAPPVLEFLRFDPPAVEGGGVTTLTIQARDDLSGVKSFSGEIRSPNGLATLPFWSQVAGGGNTFTFSLTIPLAAESGIWYVSWISITDGADNALLIQAPAAARAPSGGTLTVTSSQSDSTPPEVLQIWFDKPTVEGGERNVIRIDARDEASGVTSIMGACQSASKSALIWFTGALDSATGTWAGDVPIPTSADCGNWGVQQLSAKDKAGNTTLLIGDSPILARAGFQVAFRAECDSTPPTLDAFDLSPTIVSSETATEISVTAAVHDQGSGAATMTGWFDGPVADGGQAPKNYLRCSPDSADPEAPWSCKIQVPRLAAKGTWKVGVIRLEDKARNFREYTAADPVVADRVFEVR